MDDRYSPARVDAAIVRIQVGSAQTAAHWASQVQAAMRRDAPWTDRNGPSMTGKNARESLEAEVGTLSNGDITIIARSTRQTTRPWKQWDGAPVGAFLELSTRYMKKRQVIWPTVEALAPLLKDSLQAMLTE